MTGNRILLDTNIISAWLNGEKIVAHKIWIATIAQQHGLTLITRDKHFEEIDGLSIENW